MKKQLIRTTTFTVLLAAYLVYPGDLFAQENETGKYRIKISKDEDGQRTEIDTSFSSHEEMKSFLRDQDVNVHTSGTGQGSQVFVFHSKDGGEITAEMKEELEKADKELRKAKKELKKARKDLSDEEIEELMNELEQIRIEVESEIGEDGEERTEIIIGGAEGESENVMILNHGDHNSSEEVQKHIIELSEDPDGGKIEKVIIIRTSDDDAEKVIQKKRINKSEEAEMGSSLTEEDSEVTITTEEAAEPESYRIADGHLSVYPNPNRGMLNISYTPVNEEPVSIRILDSRGRTVAEEILIASGLLTRTYDLQSSSKGTYLIQIRQGKHWRHEKVVLK